MAKYFNCPECSATIGYYSKECKECNTDLSGFESTNREEVKFSENVALPAEQNATNSVTVQRVSPAFTMILILSIIGGVFFFQNQLSEPKVEVNKDEFFGMYELPSNGEKAKYYLGKQSTLGDLIITEHARVSISSTGYSETKIDCSKMLYMDLAYNNLSFDALRYNKYDDTSWTKPTLGSSKSSLIQVVCGT
jgi:hypothetical protein